LSWQPELRRLCRDSGFYPEIGAPGGLGVERRVLLSFKRIWLTAVLRKEGVVADRWKQGDTGGMEVYLMGHYSSFR
jgi:hypothetical protein